MEVAVSELDDGVGSLGESGSLYLFVNVVREVAVSELDDGVGSLVCALHDGDFILVTHFLYHARISVLAVRSCVVEVLLERLEIVLLPVDRSQIASGLLAFQAAATASSAISSATSPITA